MDQRDDLRVRVDALEDHAHEIERPLRWGRGIVLGAVTLGLWSWMLPLSIVYSAEDRFERHSVETLFVINSPSSQSQGPDSILTFSFRRRNIRVFFGAENNLTGLTDIACKPKRPRNIIVSRSVFPSAAGFSIFSASGRIIHALPSGSPGSGNIPLAFDHTGNFYAAESDPGDPNQVHSATVFKNDVSFASLPPTGIGRLAVDSRGNIFLTDPFISPRVFRIDQDGNVTIFADATKGLNRPYGLAIDGEDNIFVANNPPSLPAFILKFDPAGAATSFAEGISSQPGIRSMTFDRKGHLYAALFADNTILKFDKIGNPSVFADASDGLSFPSAITVGSCPVRKTEREEED